MSCLIQALLFSRSVSFGESTLDEFFNWLVYTDFVDNLYYCMYRQTGRCLWRRSVKLQVNFWWVDLEEWVCFVLGHKELMVMLSFAIMVVPFFQLHFSGVFKKKNLYLTFLCVSDLILHIFCHCLLIHCVICVKVWTIIFTTVLNLFCLFKGIFEWRSLFALCG